MSEEPAESDFDGAAWRRDLEELVMLAAELAPPGEREQAELRRAAFEPARLLGALALPEEAAPDAGAEAGEDGEGPRPPHDGASPPAHPWSRVRPRILLERWRTAAVVAGAFTAGFAVGAFALGARLAAPTATAARPPASAPAAGPAAQPAGGAASAQLPGTGRLSATPAPAVTIPAASPPERRMITAPLGLRVRSAPSGGAEVVTSAQTGWIVTVLAHTIDGGGWYEVSTPDGSGWITDDPTLSVPVTRPATP